MYNQARTRIERLLVLRTGCCNLCNQHGLLQCHTFSYAVLLCAGSFGVMQPKVTKGSGWGQPFSQMGRLGTVLVLLAGACIGYLASSSSHSSSSGPTAGARLQELLGCWHAPGLSSPGQASVLQDKLTYKHYYIATSTIPGAGLGVFARHDMPKGMLLM